MKVLQLVHKPQRRGAEVFAYQLSQALRQQGHTIRTVYLYPWLGDSALPLEREDRTLKGEEQNLLERLPGVHPKLLLRLSHEIAAFQPDVVQVNGASAVKYGAFARRIMRRRPWVLIYRNIGNPQDWVRGWQRRFFYQRLVMPQVDGVVGVSQMTLNGVKSFYQLQVPLRCIPNGVELVEPEAETRAKVRQQTRTPLNVPVLLFVGSLSSEKRVDRLLRVTAAVRSAVPNLHLWLIGNGPERKPLETQVHAAGLADAVQFLGIQADVAAYMAAADLFVLTSDTEGIPAVILEAGAQGLPVVATRVGGMAECVLDGETGVLVAPQDEAGLATAVLTLLSDPVRRQMMGERAKSWVRETFAIEKIAQQYLAFYAEVLALRQGQKVAEQP